MTGWIPHERFCGRALGSGGCGRDHDRGSACLVLLDGDVPMPGRYQRLVAVRVVSVRLGTLAERPSHCSDRAARRGRACGESSYVRCGRHVGWKVIGPVAPTFAPTVPARNSRRESLPRSRLTIRNRSARAFLSGSVLATIERLPRCGSHGDQGAWNWRCGTPRSPQRGGGRRHGDHGGRGAAPSPVTCGPPFEGGRSSEASQSRGGVLTSRRCTPTRVEPLALPAA